MCHFKVLYLLTRLRLDPASTRLLDSDWILLSGLKAVSYQLWAAQLKACPSRDLLEFCRAFYFGTNSATVN
jgi:hypothetical protein